MKLKRFYLVLFISLIINSDLTAFAADADSLILGELNARRKSERIEIAKDIKAKINLLDSYLPNPKPSEITWITQERIAIEKLTETDARNARLIKLYESPEFQHNKLKNLLESIKSSLNCITTEKVNLGSEMLCWAVTSHNLSDSTVFDDSIMILMEHNKLPKDIAKKTGLWEAVGYGGRYRSFARGIMKYIVIPYLAGKIKQ